VNAPGAITVRNPPKSWLVRLNTAAWPRIVQRPLASGSPEASNLMSAIGTVNCMSPVCLVSAGIVRSCGGGGGVGSTANGRLLDLVAALDGR
jgi:hypothetical protein